MTAINRRTVYGRIVPALAVLYGLSVAFTDVRALQSVLLFALIAAASLGWLAPAGCSTDGRRREGREARREARAQRASGGVVLEGTPQDTIRTDPRG
ncbi:MAG: hypothetical protein M9891_03965 [Austwickia sp.]|nr:hypothetical protein [Actinomycetota bacterium]MCB1252411.1 hypothetical protein [Austwickia sp.]MCO5308441.1 hypothetical protein [Austwickia sp.]